MTIPQTVLEGLRARPMAVAHHQRHHLYHAAAAYLEAGKLAAFITRNFADNPELCQSVGRLLIPSISPWARNLASFQDQRLVGHTIIQAPSLGRAFSLRCMGSRNVHWDTKEFQEFVADKCIRRRWNLHTHCTGGYKSFARIRRDGLVCVLEQYAGDRRQGREILGQEFDAWGIQTDETLFEASGFSWERILQNEEEYDLADVILAGSAFVKKTLMKAGVDEQKITVIPYGVNAKFKRCENLLTYRRENEVLRVAFLGHGGVLKGLRTALEAAQLLGPSRIHIEVIGESRIPDRLLMPFQSIATFHGTKTGKELIDLVWQCHAGVLTSLWEGSALAVYEMLAAGLPVIVTENTGSLVQNGRDGFVVPIRDAEAVASSMLKLLDEDLRRELAIGALTTSGQATWTCYRKGILSALGLQLPSSQNVVDQVAF